MNTPIGKLTQSVTTAFDPRTIPGCQLWLDGTDPNGSGTTPVVGSTVSTWIDKSGNGRNGTATGTPTFLSGGGISFNGSSYYTNTSFAYNLSTRSVFLVAKVNTYLQFAGLITFIPNPSSGVDQNSITGMSVETGTNTGVTFNQYLGGPATIYSSILTSTITNVNLYNDNMNGTVGSGFVNGNSITAITTATTAGTTSGFGIGSRWQGSMSASLTFTGNIYEILLYNGPVTTSQRQQVEGYLTRKWGLTSSLPATHPFRSFPPMPRMFQPIDISGCTLWLDAADNTTFTYSGANITQWNDKSGNANHASNSTGTMLPTLGTSSVSLPAVDFNSAYLMNNNAFGLSNMSVFVVGEERVTNASNNYSGIIVFKGITGGPNAGTTEDYAQTNAILIATPSATETTTSIQVYSQLPPFPQLAGTGGNGYWTYRLYEVFIRTGTASEIFLNGTSNASYTLKNRSGNSAGYLLSARQFNGSFTVGRLKHSEVLSYDRVLSTSERQQVESYLANKWALRGNLASTHPFKLYNAVTPAFTPIQISGCQLWLDAADATTITFSSGSNVSQWNDKSGSNNHAFRITGTPTYVSNSIQLVGSNTDLLRTSNSLSLTIGSNTLFAVAKLNNPTGFNDFIAFPDITYQGYTGANSIRYDNGILILQDFTWNYDFGNKNYYVNGIFNPTTNTSSTYSVIHQLNAINQNTSGNTRINISDTFLSRYFTGNVYEILLYNTALSSNNRQAVEGYLANKWGLTGSLPATHPYKKFRN